MWLEPLISFLTYQRWFFYFARYSVLGYVRLFHGLSIEGQENIPSKGGLIVAANHFSSLDPPVLGVCVPRPIDYMAKKELFDTTFGNILMQGLIAFPVDRSKADMTAIKEALRRLQQGRVVGIFIQGTRNAGDAEALNGAAFLAQRGNVPIVPAAIWRKSRRFYVRFGSPLQAGDRSKETMQALTNATMERIHELMG
ncbi:MAG: lysophospholipid acyltransferase family protein [Deinococcales bacterium]